MQPDGVVDPALVGEQAYAVTTFLNGVMVRQVIGDPRLETAEELTRLLHALVAGIAASHHAHASQVDQTASQVSAPTKRWGAVKIFLQK